MLHVCRKIHYLANKTANTYIERKTSYFDWTVTDNLSFFQIIEDALSVKEFFSLLYECINMSNN